MKNTLYAIALFFLFSYGTTLYCQSVISNDDCFHSIKIEPEKEIRLDLRFAKIDPFKCNQPSHYGDIKGVWFEITGKNKLVYINKLLPSGVPVINVFEGNCSSLKCVDNINNHFFGKAGVKYKILVGTYINDFSKTLYSISFSEEVLSKYSQCNDPLIMDCNKTHKVSVSSVSPYLSNDQFGGEKITWIKINGDGKNKTLAFESNPFYFNNRFTIFNKDCNDLNDNTTIYGNNSVTFSTTPGVSKIVGIKYDFDYTLRLACSAPEDKSNICTNAIALECGENYSGNITSEILPDFESGNLAGIWYKTKKGKKRHTLKLSGQTYNAGVRVYKSNDTTCSGLIPFGGFGEFSFNPFGLATEYHFNTAENELLFFKIYGQPGSFDFNYSCSEKYDDNFSCDKVKNIECDSNINIYTVRNEYEKINNHYEPVGFWYSLSEGKSYRLSALTENATIFASIYQKNCDSLIKYHSFNLNLFERDYIIHVKKGEKFFLKLFANSTYGSTSVKINCEDISENLICDYALPLECSGVYNIEDSVKVLTLNNKPSDFSLGGNWFEFIGDGSVLSFYSLDPFAYFYFEIFEGDCGMLKKLNRNNFSFDFSNFRLATEKGKNYYLKIVLPEFQKRLNFSVSCNPPIINRNCTSAIYLECGSENNFTFNAHNYTNFELCDSTSYGEWYKVSGNDKLISFTTGFLSNINIFEGDCNKLVCSSFGKNSVRFYGKKNKEYFIKLHHNFTGFAPIYVNCFDYVENSCDKPEKITCGDTLSLSATSLKTGASPLFPYFSQLEYWIEISDSGHFYNLKPLIPGQLFELAAEIYLFNCSTLTYSSLYFGNGFPLSNLTLPTIAGYKFVVRLSSSNAYGNIKFLVSCDKPENNQSCENAYQIECGKNYSFNTKNRSTLPTSALLHYRSAWYSIKGDNTFTTIEHNQKSKIRYTVYEKTEFGCDSLKIVQSTLTQQGFGYYLREGKNYMIEFWNTPDVPEDLVVDFNLDCIKSFQNDNCKNALNLECDKEYLITNIGAQQNSFGGCSPKIAGNWLTLKGTGKIINLFMDSILSFDQGYSILIGTGTCDSIHCIDHRDLTFDRNYLSFATEKNKTYFFKVYSKTWFRPYFSNLRISCNDPSLNFSCNKSILLSCDTVLQGNTYNIPADLRNPCSNTTPGLYYHIIGDGKLKVFSEISEKTPYLSIDVFQNSCNERGRCLYKAGLSPYNKNFVLETKVGVSYYLKFYNEVNENSGPFRLSLRCIQKPENTNCENAVDIECNSSNKITLINPLGTRNVSNCGSFSTGVGYWYRVPLSDQLLQVSFNHTENLYVEVVRGVCNQFSCIGQFRNIDNNFIIQNTRDQDTYIVIYSENINVKPIEFRLACVDRAKNDDCASPKLLNCGETYNEDFNISTYNQDHSKCFQQYGNNDLWYEVSGNGKEFIMNFTRGRSDFSGSVSLYEKSDCSNLNCINSKFVYSQNGVAEYSFRAEKEKKYLIQVSTSNIFTKEIVKIVTSCKILAENDICENAIEVFPNEKRFVDFTGGTKDVNHPCLIHYDNTIWYKIEGNDSLLVVEGVHNNPAMDLFVFTACNTSSCSHHDNLSQSVQGKFFAAAGTTYYMALSGRSDSIKFYSVEYAANSSCEKPVRVTCGESYAVNNENFLNNSVETYCHRDNEVPGWFELIGTGENFNLEFSSFNSFGRVNILSSCLSPCLHTHDFSPDSPSGFTLETVKGSRYLIQVIIYKYPIAKKEVKFKLTCNEGPNNSSVREAVPLVCGNLIIDPSKRGVSAENGCYSYRREYYYKFKGNSKSLNINTDGIPADIEVVDTFCQVLFRFSPADSSFITEQDKSYFLVIGHNRNFPPDRFNLNISYNCTSDLVTNSRNKDEEISIYPNPFNRDLNISAKGMLGSDIFIEVLKASGEVLFTVHKKVNDETTKTILPEDLFPVPGLYTIRVKHNNNTHISKVIKID